MQKLRVWIDVVHGWNPAISKSYSLEVNSYFIPSNRLKSMLFTLLWLMCRINTSTPCRELVRRRPSFSHRNFHRRCKKVGVDSEVVFRRKRWPRRSNRQKSDVRLWQKIPPLRRNWSPFPPGYPRIPDPPLTAKHSSLVHIYFTTYWLS